MDIRTGDMEEICNDDGGLCRTWYFANIAGSNGMEICVEYENLRTYDSSKLLTEAVVFLHIRPIPSLLWCFITSICLRNLMLSIMMARGLESFRRLSGSREFRIYGLL